MPNRKKRPVTLKDIAQKCGLSVAAVSRCMDPNPGSTIRVSATTMQRVVRTAEKLGYRHNLAARSLRKGRTETIGLVCFQSFLRSSAHRLLEAVLAVKHRNHRPYVYHMHDDSKGACEQVCEAMLDQRVDGILLLSPPDSFPQGEVDKLLSANVPVVVLSSPALHGVPRYVPDKEEGFYLVARHLIEEGYDSIHLVTGRITDGEDRPGSQTRAALRGCRRAVEELRPDAPDCLGVQETESSMVLSADPPEHDTRRIALVGYAAAKLLSDLGRLPDALMFQNTVAAAGAMRGLAEAGVRVPWDVAVAGFSAEPFTSLGPVPMTVVEHSFHEQCEMAADHLVRLIGGEQMIGHETICNPYHLIIRQSSVRRPWPPLLAGDVIKNWLPGGLPMPVDIRKISRSR